MREKRIALIDLTKAQGTCELCGNADELRPYGPNGEKICFECGMKDEATTSKRFRKILKNNDAIVYRRHEK